MKCNYDPFDDDEHGDLSFSFNPDAPPQEQIANLIFRFSEYRKVHRHMYGCLNTISAIHYKVCDTKTLIELKQPIQVMLFVREALRRIDEALSEDIEFCNNFLEKMKSEENLDG